MFHVGQKVVCVDDEWPIKNGVPGFSYYVNGPCPVVKGTVYTVRGIFDDSQPWYRSSIYLVEVCREPYQGVEIPLAMSRFRPVVTTDISVFEAMLVPTPKEKVEA